VNGLILRRITDPHNNVISYHVWCWWLGEGGYVYLDLI
jgi:hypothetical protein